MRITEILAFAWGATVAGREIYFEIAQFIARIRKKGMTHA